MNIFKRKIMIAPPKIGVVKLKNFLTHDVPSRLEEKRAKSIKFENYFHKVDGKKDAIQS